jgi:peptidoglycan/LPS O-acetylase OafA/YrhL
LIRERSSDRVMSGGQRLKHYRPDIDGLRAVAVLPVVLFHAHVVGFGGGYVGVDIFFVISGYLISLILLRSLDRDAFRITTFYERRIRRILPALAAMALVATAAAIWLLPPRELQAFGRSLQATALFYSNFHFATLTGYFDAPASTRPLLHTWSLGVEEQFYIVWPIALYLAYRLKLGRKTLIILVSLLLVASLSIAEWKSDGPSSARYFFLPS